MLSLILSCLGAICTGLGLGFSWPGHPIWTTVACMAAFLGIMAAINFALKNKLEAAFKSVQQHIMDRQAVLNRKVNAIANSGRATPKFQAEIEKEQATLIREAIDMLKVVQPFEKWNFMVRKQSDTLRAQFYFQLKEFEQADKYLKTSILFDPMIMAMQITRFYKLGQMDKVEKCFKKGARRFKDAKGVLLYALYSWILVQENRIDDAIQVLVQAKTRAENDTLKQNWDHLVNGRLKRFSNAPLGEQWFALYLETPKQQRIRVQQGGFGGFGGRRR